VTSAIRKHFATLGRTGAWDELYDGPETSANISFRVRLARTLELLPRLPRRVLDLGCGPGVLAPRVVDRGARYVGLDFAGAMLLRARERCSHAHLVRATMALPFRDQTFDAVVALGFVEYLTDIVGALREMRRVCRSGGAILVSAPKRLHVDTLTVGLAMPARWLASLVRGRRSDSVQRHLIQPDELDTLALEAGLLPDGGRHYHFTPMPYPFTVVTPRIAHRVNRRFEVPLEKGWASFFAHGYIGRYRVEPRNGDDFAPER
jgi:SAM-dependent methyltransferase